MKRAALFFGILIALAGTSGFAGERQVNVRIETVSEVPAGFSDGEFVFREEKIPAKLSIEAEEEVVIDGKTYAKGDVIDTGKGGSAFRLPAGKYKAVVHDSRYFRAADARSFEAGDEDQTVTVRGSVPQKRSITVKNAGDGFTYALKADADIRDAAGSVICPEGTVIRTESGREARFDNLPVQTVFGGRYEVSEKEVPEGCFAADPVPSAGDQDEEITFTEKTTVTTFRLVDEAGRKIDEDGFSLALAGEAKELTGRTVKALKPGEEMTVRSEAVPDGYLPFEKAFTVADDDTEQVVEIRVGCTKARVSVLDTDGSLVAGCSLVLSKAGRTVETFTSGRSAKPIRKLAAGEYTLRMTNAPKGYCVGRPVTFTVGGKEEEVRLRAVRPKGYVLITLVSVVNRTPLAGAVFDFRDSSGHTVCSVTTDRNGRARTVPVPIGEYKDGAYTGRALYRLKETRSAEGYVCDDTEYRLLFDYVDDATAEVHIEAMLPNRSETDEPVKMKLVTKQVPANKKGLSIQTGDKRMLLVAAALAVIIALICLTFIPPAVRKRKRKKERGQRK